MLEYGLDLDAGHIVRWLRDDQAAGRRRKLDVRATREYDSEPVAEREDAGIIEELNAAVLTAIGTLEVRSVGVTHPWLLRVRVVDVVGSHLPEDESVPEDAEEIDLDALLNEFILPDRGTVSVSVECETPEGKQAFDRVLSEMITDQHGP